MRPLSIVGIPAADLDRQAVPDCIEMRTVAWSGRRYRRSSAMHEFQGIGLGKGNSMASQPNSSATAPGNTLVGRIEGKARAAAELARDRLRIEKGPNDSTRLMNGTAAIHAQRAARHTFRHLWDAEVSVYSQWGEDGILDFLCDAFQLAKPKALELGAGNFSECNTRFLAEHRLASVVAVDGRKDLASALSTLDLEWKTTVKALEQWITPDNVEEIRSTAQDFMGGLDILSLDIDGNDYWVAEAIDLTSVSIIVVEYNAIFGSAPAVSVPRNDQFDRTQAHYSWLYFGASLRAFVDLFAKRGFDLAGTNRVGTNAFFIRKGEVVIPNLQVPNRDELAPYVDLRLRESRDQAGMMNYLAGSARREVIKDLPLIDVNTRKATTLAAHPA